MSDFGIMMFVIVHTLTVFWLLEFDDRAYISFLNSIRLDEYA